MSALVIAAAAPVGAVVGLGAGALGLHLERIERLREEEEEERQEYLAEQQAALAAAAAAGTAPAEAAAWREERYGRTLLETALAPLLGAVGFVCFVSHEDLGVALLVHLAAVSLFVHVAVFDIKHRLILNRVTYPAIVLALAAAPISPGVTLKTAVIGAVAVFGFFFLQSLVLGGSVLGMGDAKLGAIVGALTGLGFDLDHLGAVYAIIAAVISAGLCALALLVTRVRGLRDPIPYGPFLCVGAALIIYHGPAGP